MLVFLTPDLSSILTGLQRVDQSEERIGWHPPPLLTSDRFSNSLFTVTFHEGADEANPLKFLGPFLGFGEFVQRLSHPDSPVKRPLERREPGLSNKMVLKS